MSGQRQNTGAPTAAQGPRSGEKSGWVPPHLRKPAPPAETATLPHLRKPVPPPEAATPPHLRKRTQSTENNAPPHLRKPAPPTETSVPPHLRKPTQQSEAAIPPHLRKPTQSTEAATPHLSKPTQSNENAVPPHLRKPAPPTETATPPQKRVYSTLQVIEGGIRTPPDTPSPVAHNKSPTSNRLTTDGPVDDLTESFKKLSEATSPTPKQELTPPVSPKETPVKVTIPTEPASFSKDATQDKLAEVPVAPSTTPAYVARLAPLAASKLAQIPSPDAMVTFSVDLLLNHIDGLDWSPGLIFVPPSRPCVMLPNRVYYTANRAFDPHLPPAPGTHGARLVPFFNGNPEESDEHWEALLHLFPSGTNTWTNVPLFVLTDVPVPGDEDGRTRKRYIYYGHYSQTRFSDKLGYDQMTTSVPAHVRTHWADKLARKGRPEWVSEALRAHYFPPPAYAGAIMGAHCADGGSLDSGDFAKREKAVERDLRKYGEQLAGWKREVDAKMALMDRESILSSFEAADAEDDPKPLRMWWEYLECVDWRKDFYDLLVGLQAANASYA